MGDGFIAITGVAIGLGKRVESDIGELEHIKYVIKCGSDYLLKVFAPPGAKSNSTVGSAGNDTKNLIPNDINCWKRPEDMSYERPVSVCNETASDLAGEIIAALSAASIVFKQDNGYSLGLVKTAEKIYEEARKFYDSSGYKDELVWGGTWLFFATGNHTYLDYATANFAAAADNETMEDKGIFNWNNKITANAVLFTRLRFFLDIGFPYEKALGLASNTTEQLMCSYLSDKYFNTTPGGLILSRPDNGGALQYAGTAYFLGKLFNDYLTLIHRSGWNCSDGGFSLEMLQSFSTSQASLYLSTRYNPRKMSYMVGFGDHYPTRVHHWSASIPLDGQYHSCTKGGRWLNSQDPNTKTILGPMVAGPDRFDDFSDERDKPWFTEPSIASNAGLVAALIAHHDPPQPSSASNSPNLGLDLMGVFEKVNNLASPNPLLFTKIYMA
ncbi:putative LRR receptor-like serine/threonine-protein kinase [Hibiscus syriacus]|uniref:cellulase n=1 Tax=Hibiscus syriacus TaxID=106335 RepID=A0A6A3BRQ0_HIBSY|nr:putative LRR receptor-like serine/threonine-protein kinase [Hibiscus syriacus]